MGCRIHVVMQCSRKITVLGSSNKDIMEIYNNLVIFPLSYLISCRLFTAKYSFNPKKCLESIFVLPQKYANALQWECVTTLPKMVR